MSQYSHTITFLLRNVFENVVHIFFFISTSQFKDHKGKDGTDKPCLSPKGLKAQKKMKPPDAAGADINILYSYYICQCLNSI